MKKFLILFFYTWVSAFSQEKKEVENGLYITFPTTVTYNLIQDNATYMAKTDNCIFMAIVQRNVIPDYEVYIEAQKKWSEAEKKKVIDNLLDNAVKGKLDYTGNKGTIEDFKVGDFNGRRVLYSAINPVNGERTKRCSVILSLRDRLISFDAFFMDKEPNSKAEQEMNNFFSSIATK